MTALVDARPGGLDALFRPGNTFPVALTWPTGELAGRTFTAGLGIAPLDLFVVGDVMTITVSEAQTAAAVEGGAFTLTETTGGTTQDLIAGRWSPSARPGTPTSLAVTVVTDGPLPVEVSVAAELASPEVEPNLRTAIPVDWPERVFSTDANCPATDLTFEHGRAVGRGSGAGAGIRSNRRSVFMIPGSPGGYSRMRSRISGPVQTGILLPQWGHMHGVGVNADGNRYGVIVWTDVVINSVVNLNYGIWRAEGGPAGSFQAGGGPHIEQRTVTDGARAANVVTLQVPGGHPYRIGDQVQVDVADNTYDGAFVVTATTPTTIVYAQTAADDASCGAGLIRPADQDPAAFRAQRQVAVTDAVRTAGVVTATIPGVHSLTKGDTIIVDLADASYDGTFIVSVAPAAGVVTWRQAAADDPSSGAGTVSKRLPYWIESEWLPGMVRARCWPDADIGNTSVFDPAVAGGYAWNAPPPWESPASFTVGLTGLPNPEPDPAFGEGCSIVAAHMASGSTVTECRYDNIMTMAL